MIEIESVPPLVDPVLIAARKALQLAAHGSEASRARLFL